MNPRCARARLLIPVVVALLLTGCGSGRYPVKGRVTYEDGSPVEAGTVIAESTVDGKPVGVQARIASDGSFSLGGDRPGDGAFPGSYRVLVMPPALGDGEKAEGKQPLVSGKYSKYESSGLKLEVKPESNVFNITVSRPKPRGKAKDSEE